jgi:cobalamin biosynthesis Mg chelatase CobN
VHSENIITSFESLTDYTDKFGRIVTGYFKAPATGRYRFKLACNHSCRLDMDPTAFGTVAVAEEVVVESTDTSESSEVVDSSSSSETSETTAVDSSSSSETSESTAVDSSSSSETSESTAVDTSSSDTESTETVDQTNGRRL